MTVLLIPANPRRQIHVQQVSGTSTVLTRCRQYAPAGYSKVQVRTHAQLAKALSLPCKLCPRCQPYLNIHLAEA